MTANEAKNAYQRQYMKKYRAENRNKYQREWKRDNPDKVKEYNRRYWERKAERMSKGKEGE